MDDKAENLKKLQELELENLKVLIHICEENHLRYYIIGGSLIGVLRHQGFIPWDDDLDVGIPRPDYNQFVKIAKNYLPEHMDIKTMTSDPNYKCYFTRLINNRKKILWDHGQYVAEIGIWMDVFPLDGLPGNSLARRIYVFRANMIKAVYKFTQIDYVTTNKERPFTERFLIKFAKLTKIGKLFSADRSLARLDRHLQKYDYETAPYLWNFSGCYGKKEIVPRLQLSGSRTAIFENTDVSIPEDSEGYLTNIYGNYMEMPPEEQRVSHEVTFAENKEQE